MLALKTCSKIQRYMLLNTHRIWKMERRRCIRVLSSTLASIVAAQRVSAVFISSASSLADQIRCSTNRSSVTKTLTSLCLPTITSMTSMKSSCNWPRLPWRNQTAKRAKRWWKRGHDPFVWNIYLAVSLKFHVVIFATETLVFSIIRTLPRTKRKKLSSWAERWDDWMKETDLVSRSLVRTIERVQWSRVTNLPSRRCLCAQCAVHLLHQKAERFAKN